MNVEIPVSVGELIDKISILKIKQAHAQRDDQLMNILNELRELEARVPKGIPYEEFLQPLLVVNSTIWDIEDRIRKYEMHDKFDTEFIQAARMIYKYNDERAIIKREINIRTNSTIVEEKIY